jgi:hypothetical protein
MFETLDKSRTHVPRMMQGVIAAEAVRKEQGSLEPEIEEINEGATHGGAADTTANNGETRGIKRPEVVEKDHTWDETLKSIEDLLPSEGGFHKTNA